MGRRTTVALTAISAFALLGASVPASPGMEAAETFTVALTAQEEVGTVGALGLAGDPDGAGTVRLTVDSDNNRLCYDFTLSGLGTPLMAHIHRGHVLESGPTVVTLFTGPGGDLHNCVVWTPKRLAEIVADPSNFYVNLSTTECPDGALRGQLQG